MANSPTDLGESFKKSGMTLITQPASDRWLNMARAMKQESKRVPFTERIED